MFLGTANGVITGWPGVVGPSNVQRGSTTDWRQELPPELELLEPLEVHCRKEADGSHGSVKRQVFGTRARGHLGTGKSRRILEVPPTKVSFF